MSDCRNTIFKGIDWSSVDVAHEYNRHTKSVRQQLEDLKFITANLRHSYVNSFAHYHALSMNVRDDEEVPILWRQQCAELRNASDARDTMYAGVFEVIERAIEEMEQDLHAGKFFECQIMLLEVERLLQPVREDVKLTEKAINAHQAHDKV